MDPVEYKPSRRPWFRDVMIGIAVSGGTELVRSVLHAAVHLLG
ncbi:DUF6408 family protein [Streptomyces melanogenes]|uniref:Uncharacterized protein n=1 Tax=Streptomyces melanogenes TaxID=67326 RepID=A0ABZ1XH00_9ACTN|nr:DUF6408 family protein [Streptomyces melanogenes]